MQINGKEAIIGARYFNSISVMVINGEKGDEFVNEYLDLDTEIIYTNSKNVEIKGCVKSYNSMLTTENTIIEVPLNSQVKKVSDNFKGHTIETEDSNLDIMYNALDIQEHASITNIDGFENINENDISLQSNMSINITPQRGIIDGLSFSTNSNQNILIDTGGSLPRIDLVVLRKDQLNRTIEIAIKKGEPSSSPSLPTYKDKQTPKGFYELPIFKVYVDIDQTVLSRNNIRDMRNPTSKENTVTKSEMSGMIMAFSGNMAKLPSNVLFCDGREISRTTYARLFDVVGTTWGVGNGTTTFHIPDGRGGVLKGAGQSSKYGTYTQRDGTVVNLNENRGSVGSYQSTAIRNITGEFEVWRGEVWRCSGSFTSRGSNYVNTGSGDGYRNNKGSFSASRSVPVGQTNRDNNLAVNWVIFF